MNEFYDEFMSILYRGIMEPNIDTLRCENQECPFKRSQYSNDDYVIDVTFHEIPD